MTCRSLDNMPTSHIKVTATSEGDLTFDPDDDFRTIFTADQLESSKSKAREIWESQGCVPGKVLDVWFNKTVRGVNTTSAVSSSEPAEQ